MGQSAEILTINSEQEKKRSYFFQVDVLKTIMIFLVIFDHSIPWDIKDNLGVALWERISIPVFLVIMGFNMGLSFQKKKNHSLNNLYSWKYFRHKIMRYLFPFLILYFISSIIGGIIYGASLQEIIAGQWGTSHDARHLLVGILPFWGPGNWFIPVIFGSIIVMPLIYKGFSGSTFRAVTSLVICFLIEFSLQLFVYDALKIHDPPPPTYPTFLTWDDYYNALLILYSVFFYLSAIGLGMWFSRNHDIFNVRNWFMWIIFPLSLTYLIAYQFFGFGFKNENGVSFITGDYNFLVFPYSAFLILIALKILPSKSKNWFSKGIKKISRSTYHILLTQILYFAIVVAIYGDHYRASIFGINPDQDIIAFLYLIINWIICIPIGVFWWYTEKKLKNILRKNIKIKRPQE
ncbi:MAG: acyltransferase family protein [Promethearchaeota archaeon]